jgi:hypothetical protein
LTVRKQPRRFRKTLSASDRRRSAGSSAHRTAWRRGRCLPVGPPEAADLTCCYPRFLAAGDTTMLGRSRPISRFDEKFPTDNRRRAVRGVDRPRGLLAPRARLCAGGYRAPPRDGPGG